jgi:hypothetical protein
VKTRTTLRIGLFSLVAALASCAASSASFVGDLPGYSVTSGRITRIEGLHAEQIVPLSDGVAVTVSQPGCRVLVEFQNGDTRVFDAGRGVILVHGYSKDYILSSQLDEALRSGN